MRLIIYYDEQPDPEALKKVGEMIAEGFKAGYDSPPGLIWKIEEEE